MHGNVKFTPCCLFRGTLLLHILTTDAMDSISGTVIDVDGHLPKVLCQVKGGWTLSSSTHPEYRGGIDGPYHGFAHPAGGGVSESRVPTHCVSGKERELLVLCSLPPYLCRGCGPFSWTCHNRVDAH